MLIDLRKLEDFTVAFDLSIEPSEADLSIRFSRMLKPASFSGRYKREDWIVRVSGNSAVALERKCDRCLEKGKIDVEVLIDHAYVKYDALDEERETRLDTEGFEYSVIDSDELDLKEVFGEHLLLAIPDRFVCGTECRGLCPHCGANLNTAPCDCVDKVVDPRWAALDQIKKDFD